MKTLTTLSFLLSYFFITAQDSTTVNFRILLTPTQFLFQDFPVSIEKHFGKRHTLGLTASYRPCTRSGGEVQAIAIGAYGGYEDQNMANKLYSSYTLGINSKYYYGAKLKTFVDLQLFYRNWAFDNKQASFQNVEGYRFSGLRTENQNVYGMKLVVGRSVYKDNNKRYAMVLDFFVGFALRYKSISFLTTDGYVFDRYYNSYTEKRSSFSGNPQVGLKLGILKRKK